MKKLSDALWKAANEHLWDGVGEQYGNYGSPERFYAYSCDAVQAVCRAIGANPDSPAGQAWKDVKENLARWDCPVDSFGAFDEFEFGEEAQGARYMWLLIAMHAAEDEGL